MEINNKKLLIPKRLQIETIFGCNANCVMCAVNLPSKRKKGIMPLEMSKYILDELSPYTNQIEKLDLYVLGEPLLDPYIFQRIKYAKNKGFQSIAISTNADLLNIEKQKKLLKSGVDTIIFSIDGIKKETHEKIRKGVKFERVIKNCQDIIKMRDKGNYKTRFVIRFIRQDINRDEWKLFTKFWRPKLSREKRDLIIIYNMNNWGGEMYLKKDLIKKQKDSVEKKPCHMVFDRLVVLNDGTVPLCCIDVSKPYYCLGNVKNKRPIEIFNCKEFNKIRQIHLEGKKNTLKLCKRCTLLYNEPKQKIDYLKDIKK